jgi:DNA-binding response OmpR family regulator
MELRAHGTKRETMKAHILVVDDDPRITELLKRVLAYEGYSDAASSAIAGHAAAGARRHTQLTDG